MDILETLKTLWESSGFHSFLIDGGWKNLIMIAVSCALLYLGIKKKFEPLLLVGIAFGCLLVNLSYFTGGDTSDALYHVNLWDNFLNHDHEDYHSYGAIMRNGGLLDILYIGVKAGIYPSLIFLGSYPTLRAFFSELLLRWAYSLHSSELYASALQETKLLLSVSSAVPTVLRRYSLQQDLHLIFSDLSLSQLIRTWHLSL